MRLSEIASKKNLFEMPYLMAGSIDWGLNDPARNKMRAEVILNKDPTIVWQKERETLYRRFKIDGGEFACINDSAEIIYYMQYMIKQHKELGNCATQVKVWMTIDEGVIGLPTEVFFNIMLKEFDAMISDRIQSEDGKRFWLRRMAESGRKGFRAGLLDKDTIIKYDRNQLSFSKWITDVDGWEKLPIHHERLFYISH